MYQKPNIGPRVVLSTPKASTSWWWAATTTDIAVQVFLDEKNRIRTPLKLGIAYDYASADQWNDPSCVPGIISEFGELRILHFDEVYIALPPHNIRDHSALVYEEPTSQLVSHFASRGLEHLTFVGPLMKHQISALVGRDIL